VAGLVGLRQVDIGNLMQANSTTIVVVTQMQPMSVLFTVPEDSLSNVLQRLRTGQKLAVDAFDRSLTNKIASGTLSNADNEIDTTTGTLKLRAMFDNSKFELFPNQFVNVRLLLDTLHDAIVVPGAAMQTGRLGQLRLCRQGRQHGQHARGHHRAHQRRSGVDHQGLATGEPWWSTAPISCATARK
jgi:membrane fusion protein, multidrug efflux system